MLKIQLIISTISTDSKKNNNDRSNLLDTQANTLSNIYYNKKKSKVLF